MQVILLLGYGPDAPPKKLFLLKNSKETILPSFSWKPVILFLLWTSAWSIYIMVLCGISVRQTGGLQDMFKRYLILFQLPALVKVYKKQFFIIEFLLFVSLLKPYSLLLHQSHQLIDARES